MFIIDNLDKVTYTTDNENTRYNYITSQLQDLKNKLDICVILVHHAKKVFNKQQAMMKA
jgi:RecA-family ATPase